MPLATPERLQIAGPSDQLVRSDTEFFLVDGKVERVWFTTYGIKDQAYILDVLKKKYGEPTKVSEKVLSNAMGGSASVMDATWTFSDLTVHFVGAFTWDTGRVFIETPKAAAHGPQKLEQHL